MYVIAKRAMKITRKAFIYPAIILYCFLMAGCGAEKFATQRRNFMMPKKSEMINNDKYKEAGKRKTNKVKLRKAKRKSLY